MIQSSTPNSIASARRGDNHRRRATRFLGLIALVTTATIALVATPASAAGTYGVGASCVGAFTNDSGYVLGSHPAGILIDQLPTVNVRTDSMVRTDAATGNRASQTYHLGLWLRVYYGNNVWNTASYDEYKFTVNNFSGMVNTNNGAWDIPSPFRSTRSAWLAAPWTGGPYYYIAQVDFWGTDDYNSNNVFFDSGWFLVPLRTSPWYCAF